MVFVVVPVRMVGWFLKRFSIVFCFCVVDGLSRSLSSAR